MRRGVDLPSAPASSGAASSSSLSSGGAGSTVSISEGGRDESGRDPRRTTPSSAMDGSLLARRRNSSLLLSRSSSVTTMTTGTASRELSVRIAQEMSSVLDADEDWDRHQKIQRALQRHNFTLHRLRLSDLELYGRERELNELREAFQEVADVDSTSPQPKVAVINVIGRAGTGKTRLCDELKSAVTKHNGFFLAGKFDLQNRQEPFTGLVSALSGLTIQVLERGDVFADSMKVQLTDAIGNESRALASFVPGIEELVVSVDHVSIPNDIGRATEQHPVDSGCDPSSSMATTTTEHHSVEEWDEDDKLMTRSSSLHYLFRQFFRCICRPAHPVVLMLDDMQWSDEASLSLLSSIVTDPSLSNLLVLATCREEEVDEEHPWRNFLNNLRASHSTKVACRQVVLSNLDQSAVLSIVQAALRCSEERTVWLAEIVHRKSSGNALYAIQFLSSLYDEGILRYNVGSMSWVWNERAVQSRFVTANVVDLTTAKLQKLPPQMQTLLMVAACLGRTFDKTMLNLVMNQETLASLLGSPLAPSSLGLTRADAVASTVVTARALKGLNSDEARDTLRAASHPHPAAAIQESPPHVTLPASGTLANKEEKEEDNANVDWLVASLHQLVEDSVIEHIAHYNTYCFAHDMIQEAAFRLVPEKLCGAFQREVGFALLRSHAIKELEENFYFRAIELSNVASHEIGISYLDTVHLVHHNHDAGHRAMKKAAFGAALKYFEAGLRLIGDGKSDTKLLIDLISGAVEAAFCSGNLVAMEGHIANALAVDTPIENKVRPQGAYVQVLPLC